MEKIRLNSLDSLMVFTGSNAYNNALALENREYKYNDEFIGTLQLTSSYDSVFSNYPNEIFVESTPKYTSIDNLVNISYAYITNKLSAKSIYPDGEIYINDENTFSIKYDYDKDLDENVLNSENVPFDDLNKFICSINNGLYNKQHYYRYSKELQSLINKGITYSWVPAGTILTDNINDKQYEFPNGGFVSYALYTKEVQDKKWNEETNSYEYVFEESIDENGELVKTPVYVNKTGFEYIDNYDDILKNDLKNITDEFTNKVSSEMYAYYLYALDNKIDLVCNTYSFGQSDIKVNINYDGEFNNWFNNRITLNVEKDNVQNNVIKIDPYENYCFNIAYNVNKVDYLSERYFNNTTSGNEIDFTLNNLKDDEVSVLSPYKIKSLDLSDIAEHMYGTLDLLSQYNKFIDHENTISTNWNIERGNELEALIIGKEGVQCKINKIIGLGEFKKLKYINLTGCDFLEDDPDISGLPNISDVDFSSSKIDVFRPANGSVFNTVKLPESLKSIILNDIKFNNKLYYTVNSNLTTLELNNVIGLDTYEFIHNWLIALKESVREGTDIPKLNSGLVNYVNITGVNWEYVDFNDLLDLKIIELDKFTGTINVHGPGFLPPIYRRDYLKLVDAYGENCINNPNSDLNIELELQDNVFDIKVYVTEEYEVHNSVLNQYGEYEDIVTIEQSIVNRNNPIIIHIENNPFNLTGNSLLNLIEDNSSEFVNFELENFINTNKINIGWCKKLSKPLDALININQDDIRKLTKVNKDTLERGDVLLFGQDTLIIVNKNIQNINQNFTILGKITAFDEFERYVNNISYNWLLSFEYSEPEIEVNPIKDRNNFIDVDYNDTDNLLNKEISDENIIEVEYDSTRKTIDLFEKEYSTNNEINVEFN